MESAKKIGQTSLALIWTKSKRMHSFFRRTPLGQLWFDRLTLLIHRNSGSQRIPSGAKDLRDQRPKTL